MEQNRRDEELKKSILGTLTEMETIRHRTESVRWGACALVKHRTEAFNLGTHEQMEKITLHQNDVAQATKTTIAGIMGYLLSSNIRWFNYETQGKNFEGSDTIYGAKDYLEKTVSIILSVFDNCNFYAATTLATADAFIQGTSAEMVIDDGNGGVVYDTIDPHEFYISEDQHRRVDTFYRVYEMTVTNASKKWGEALPKELKRMMRDGAGHQRVKFLHAIYPREDALSRKGKAIISTEKRFASVHYSYTGDQVFLESGYDELPVSVHRWELNGTSPYGSSPVIEVIEEAKKLDKYEYNYATGIDKQVNPAVFAPETLMGRLDLNPGGMNFVNIAQTGKPELFQSSIDLAGLALEKAQLLQKLERYLYTDLFNILMRQDRQRTATEVREIKGEGLVLLSSIIGNMQQEKITPLVMRTYSILTKSGILPPPPEELVKASLKGQVKVQLDGPLAQSMKAYHQTTGITQGMQALAAVMQLNPDSQVNVDFDELIRQAMGANGMPQTIIREKKDVKEIKKKQQEMLQQQAQAQQAQMQADTAQKMAKAPGTSAQQLMNGGAR